MAIKGRQVKLNGEDTLEKPLALTANITTLNALLKRELVEVVGEGFRKEVVITAKGYRCLGEQR